MPAATARARPEKRQDAPPTPVESELAPRLGTKRRGERAIELCDSLIDIMSALFGISTREMRRNGPGRPCLEVARIRQLAMYVAHITLRLSMKEVGIGFERDRTTVLHACHLIEDLRDDVEFDHMVAMAERIAAAAFRNRLEIAR